MKISGHQKVSLVDYDGQIATTIFISGCNFACPFCHNAGIVRGLEPIIPEQEILDYLKKRKNVLTAVCISGGEPTLNNDLIEFIRKIKDMNYLVKLDTNGTNLSMLKQLVEEKLIDYIAMDIKNSKDKYSHTIGKDLIFNLQESIDYIMNCGIDYEFRTTLINGYHTEKDIIKICKLINGARKYYLQKFEDSGNCLSQGLSEIPLLQAQKFCEIATKYIPDTHLRGY